MSAFLLKLRTTYRYVNSASTIFHRGLDRRSQWALSDDCDIRELERCRLLEMVDFNI